jgi:hypothetical protein
VNVLWQGELDEPFIEISVTYAGEKKTALVNAQARDHTFILEQKNPVNRQLGEVGSLIDIVDRAIKAVPRVSYAMGIVGVGAAAAIINIVLGLNRLAFVSILAMLVAMILLYVFSRIEKSTDIVVKTAGRTLIIVSVAAFVIFVGSSLFAAIACAPRVFVYLYGIHSECGLPPKSGG